MEPLPAMMQSLLRNAFEQSGSDLALWYICAEGDKAELCSVKSVYDRQFPREAEGEWLNFVCECRDILVLHSRRSSFFNDAFFHEKMNSSLLIPFFMNDNFHAVLCLNSLREDHYGKEILFRLKTLSDAYSEAINNGIMNHVHSTVS